MQAALTCAEYGHEVVLFEKNSELGGTLICERDVPFKKKLDMYIHTQIRSISRAGIDVRLNMALKPEYAEELKPDVIIAALGSVAVKPKIAGIASNNVLDAETVYIDPKRAGKSVIILGAGLVWVGACGLSVDAR